MKKWANRRRLSSIARRSVASKTCARPGTRVTGMLGLGKKRKFHLRITCILLLLVLSFLLSNITPSVSAGRSVSIYTPKDKMIAQWKALCDAYPRWASYEAIGKSIQGRDIWLFKIGNPSGGRVMYDGEGHGPEDGGTECLYKFCEWLLESNDSLANHILQWNYHLIIPVLNVDSTARQNMRRQYVLSNGTIISVPYGVDLSRNGIYGWGQTGSGNPNNNYEYRGLYGGSEPETMAYHNAAGKYKPDIYCNTHVGGEYMSHCSDTALEIKIESLKTQYEAQLGILNPYPVNTIRGGGQIYVDVDGSFGASGWLWEISTWSNLKPTLNEWLAIYYPRAFPILLAFAKAVETAPQIVFEDGFEGANSGWTISTTGNDTVEWKDIGALAKDGTHTVVCTVDNLEGPEMAYTTYQIPPMKACYVRAYVGFDKLPNPGTSYVPINIRAQTAAPGALIWIEVYTDKTGLSYWRANYQDATIGGTVTTRLATALQTNTWYCVEMYVKVDTQTTGECKWWIDGNLVLSKTGVNNTEWLSGVRYIMVGERWSSTINTVPVTHAGVHSIYIDCFAISDSYIGPIVAPAPLLCDVNSDGAVNMRDIDQTILRFQTTPSSPNWNPDCDVSGPIPLVPDGIVNMRDISSVIRHFDEKDL